jgi:DHA3 family macrolide efflux protein-like MFS transporter
MNRVFFNRSFRNVWLASLLSTTGSQISRVGLILYVFQFNKSVVLLGLLLILELLPGAVVAPLAGVLIDRHNKCTVMIVSDLFRMVFMLMILWHPTVGMIYVMAALHSIATIFHQPAKSALIPFIASEAERPRANGLDQSALNFTLVVGPVIGSELLVHLGLRTTLILDSLSFAASALLVARINSASLTSHISSRSFGSTISNVKAGWTYVATHNLVRHLNLLFFVSLFCAGMWMPLAPSFVQDYLAGSTQLIGWQIGVFGFGAILGGLWAPRLVTRFGNGVIVFVGLLAEGVSLSVYALVSRIEVSLLVMFCWGIVVSIIVVPFYSILQTVVEEPFLGRVFSVVKQSENVAIILAMALAVLLHSFWGSQVIFLLAGILYFLIIVGSSLSRGGRLLLMTK